MWSKTDRGWAEIVLLWNEAYTISRLNVSGMMSFKGAQTFYYLEDVEVLDPCIELHLFNLYFICTYTVFRGVWITLQCLHKPSYKLLSRSSIVVLF